MNKKPNSRFAYLDGIYFEWDDNLCEYVKQVKVPAELFAKQYKISPYDKPVACYRVLHLNSIIERLRRNHRKIPVVYLNDRSLPESDNALFTRYIMKEKPYEKDNGNIGKDGYFYDGDIN